MYASQRYDIQNTIEPVSCMYQTSRIMDHQFSPDSSAIKDLNSVEKDLDIAIKKRTLNRLENEVDRCINSVDQEVLNKAVNSSRSAKSKPSNGAQTKKMAINFNDSKIKSPDCLIQISPNFNPKLTLKVISEIQKSGKNISIRQHIHSSVNVAEAKKSTSNFEKLIQNYSNLKINREPGRHTSDYDFLFTFLISNNQNVKSFGSIDVTIHAANFAAISGDLNVARFLFDVAGGNNVETDIDSYWCEMISQGCETGSEKNMKSVLEKNYDWNGGLSDVLVGLIL